MTESHEPGESSAQPEALVVLVVNPGTEAEIALPIHDRLVIGRECGGIDASRRYLIDEEAVSRTHLELRFDAARDQAWAIDRSTNGTRVNGARIERSVQLLLRPGDRLTVGSVEFELRSTGLTSISAIDAFQTVKNISLTELVMVVGDIVSFSSISEYTDTGALLSGIDRLYAELRDVLRGYHGTVSNYVGDAFFATWEKPTNPNAAADAVGFALAAAARVREIAPGLSLRDPAGQPIDVGWAVASGPAAVSSITGLLVTVLGDATNVTFRLSGIAGRDGWSHVVVTEDVFALAGEGFSFSEPATVSVKGRSAQVTVRGVGPLGG